MVRVLPDIHPGRGAEPGVAAPAYEPARVGLLRDFLADRISPVAEAAQQPSSESARSVASARSA